MGKLVFAIIWLVVGLALASAGRRRADLLPATVGLAVGGTVDLLAGAKRRAPAWMQRAGLEWLYRVKQEPRRLWRRYLVTNAIFCGLVLRELVRREPPAVPRPVGTQPTTHR